MWEEGTGGIRNFLGTDGHGFKKTRLAARWVKAIFAKGYTESIDTARYRRAN